jgi:hypothetical protein
MQTFNARSEDFTTKPAFRDTWKRGQQSGTVSACVSASAFGAVGYRASRGASLIDFLDGVGLSRGHPVSGFVSGEIAFCFARFAGFVPGNAYPSH